MHKFSALIVAMLLICGTAHGASVSTDPLALAQALVSEVAPDHTTYRHGPGEVTWQGVDGATESTSYTDCSGLINALYGRAYGFDRPRFAALFGKARPLAITYHDQIVKQQWFDRITDIAQLQPGDVIAIRYPDGNDNTGHVLLVAARPTMRTATPPLVEGLQQWDVTIIDSSESGHGNEDTRHLASGGFRKGLGSGTFRLYGAPDGTLMGYSWSTSSKSVFYRPEQRDIVVGRLKPALATTPLTQQP